MNRSLKVICVVLAVIVVLIAAVIPASAFVESRSANKLVVPPTEAEAVSETSLPAEETAFAESGLEETSPIVIAEEETTPAVSAEQETSPAVSAEAETAPAETIAEETQTYSEIPLYFQTDYPDTLYGSGTIESSGCSITSLAMVATYLTGHEYLPDELAGYFGGYVGNNMERLEYASDMLQLPWRKAENWHDARKALGEGKIVIALMNQKSAFTDSQHFIVITGMTGDGRFLVNDAYEPNYDHWYLKYGFEDGFLESDISCGYSGAWIYDKDAMPEEPFIYVEEELPYVESRYPVTELTKEETELLASMVWLEAQGEPFEGQQAIAEIVLNRLLSDDYPNTVKGVIYSEGQFRSTKFLDEAEPTQTQYEAVERALKGPYVLPLDVVFFATYPVNEYVWGEIGGHTFCYQW